MRLELAILTDGNECLFKVLLYCRNEESGCVIVPESNCSSGNPSNNLQAYTRIKHYVISYAVDLHSHGGSQSADDLPRGPEEVGIAAILH